MGRITATMISSRLKSRFLSLLTIAAISLGACSAPAASPTAAPAAKPTTAASGAAPAATQPAAAASSAAPAKAANAAPITIGVVAPTTGNFALLGVPVRDGILLAIEDINAKGGIAGAKIESFVEDTGNSNTTATSAVQAALSKKPLAILGLPLSTQDFAAMQQFKEGRVPVFVSGTNRDLTRQGIPWVFNMYTNDDVSVDAAVRYAITTLKKTKIAVVHGNDEYGTGAAKAMAALATQLNAKITVDESFSLTDKDMSGQLTKVKNSDADVLFIWSDQATMALVIRQARQLGITIPYMTAPLLPATVKLLTPQEMEGVSSQLGSMPTKSKDPAAVDWAKRFKAKFNNDADSYSAAAYDGMMMLAQAIEKGGRDTDGIVKAMLATTDYKGVYGTHTADKYGNLTQEGLIATFKNGEYEAVQSVSRPVER